MIEEEDRRSTDDEDENGPPKEEYKFFGEWENDADVDNCRNCHKKFSALNRKHHCRACGKIYCSKCAFEKKRLPFYSTEQRVCVVCIKEWDISNELLLTEKTSPLYEFAPDVFVKEFYVGFYGAQIQSRMVVIVLQSLAGLDEGDLEIGEENIVKKDIEYKEEREKEKEKEEKKEEEKEEKKEKEEKNGDEEDEEKEKQEIIRGEEKGKGKEKDKDKENDHLYKSDSTSGEEIITWEGRDRSITSLTRRNLLVYSPSVLDKSTKEQLDSLGKVRFVLEPNKIHNQGLDSFKEAYPSALFYAPPGLEQRRSDFMFDAILTDETPVEWEVEVDQILTKGNIFFSEVLLYHRASRTIIVGDLVETFEKDLTRGNTNFAKILSWFYSVEVGTYNASPEFIHFTQDIEAANQTREYIVENWSDAKKIINMHGRKVEDGAIDVINDVFDGLFDKVKSHWKITNFFNRGLAKFS